MSKKFVRSLSLILVLSMLFVLSAIAAPAALAEGTEEEVIEEVEDEIEEEVEEEEEAEEVVVPATGDFSANVALAVAASLLTAGAAAAFVAKKQH